MVMVLGETRWNNKVGYRSVVSHTEITLVLLIFNIFHNTVASSGVNLSIII